MIDEVEIQKLSNEGRGLAFTDRPCFVLGALPGERMSVRILKKYKGIFDAVAASEPVQPSLDRVRAECPHFLHCGGCSLQHMRYDSQVVFKADRVQDLWRQFGYQEPKWMPPIVANSYGYRRKARISVRWVEKKQKLLLGFKEQDSSKILNMESCPILTENIQRHIFDLQAVLEMLPEKCKIPQLEVVEGDEGVAVVIRNLVQLSPDSCQKLIDFSKTTSWCILLQPKGNDSVFPLSSTAGYFSYSIPRYDLRFMFKPLDFIQVNHDVNLQLVDLVVEYLELESGDHVLDLFCGLGNFSLPLAKYCAAVTGIEGSQEMVIRANSNSVSSGLASKTRFFAHDLRECPRKLSWFADSYSKVLLDPPRSGAKDCIDWIITKMPKRIVYVSCNPESLVNDIGLLLKSGYVAEKACVADMFPHTKHIELIVSFLKV